MKGGEIMFNEEIKRKYIEDNKDRNLNLERQCSILFNRSEPIESKLNKDICCFSTAEIIECLKSFNSVSLESLMNARSQYKIYTDWCIVKHILVKDRQNHFKEINDEMLRQCTNNFLKERSIVSRDYIIDMCENNLMNPAERFILLGLFEGIGSGKLSYKDFEMLTMECFDVEKRKLQIGKRLITYSQKLYEYAKEAANTYENIVYDKNGNERSMKLLEDERIVKPGANASICNYRQIINKKLAKIKQELNNPAINIQSLNESGRIEMINKLMESGKTREEALEDKEMLDKYGNIPAKKRYINSFLAE